MPQPPTTSVFAAVLVALLGATGCDPGESHAAAEAPPLAVQTLVVQQQDDYQTRRLFNGTVRSRRASQLGFERSGLVSKVFVDEGEPVQEGQLIAQLDTAQLRAARRRVAAGLAEAQAGVGISTLTADRLNKLADEQFISRQSADEAKFGLQAAEAKRLELEAAIAQIDVDLRKSRLVAPFAGVVSARMVDEGTVVSAGAPVVRFRESDQKEAVVGVPTSVTMPLGSVQQLVVGGRTLDASVTGLVDDVNARTRTVKIILDLPDDVQAADGEVVELVHRRSVADSGLWVPTTALTEGLRGMWTLYSVKQQDGRSVVAREAVEVLHAETDRAFVRGTLQSGDRVIASGLHRVVPGQVVESLDAPVAEAEERLR